MYFAMYIGKNRTASLINKVNKGPQEGKCHEGLPKFAVTLQRNYCGLRNSRQGPLILDSSHSIVRGGMVDRCKGRVLRFQLW